MKRANPCPGLAGGPPAGEADLPSAAVAEGGVRHISHRTAWVV